ncbi:transcription factor ORG2-like [Castanea sativa]|uniref:transcription factor ORG2-like n=1 Tax=Castanea sativa TaxID=21020 RepID=UPI003F64DB9A
MSLEHSNYVYRETEASELFAQDYPPSQPKLEPNHSTISTSIGSSPAMVKKLHHNASERDRRKKINTLYSSLRTLLPPADQAEKLSIPATVSRMVKYIPELQQQVDILIQKKEELISRICRQGEQIHQENQRQIASRSFLSAVSASWLNDREVMIQISTYKVHKSPLAEILPNLEKDGFLILNASSFESFGGRVFYNLHLQAESTYALKREVLSEKLPSFSERGEEFNYENLGSIYFNDDSY